jgi:hypothetical protein
MGFLELFFVGLGSCSGDFRPFCFLARYLVCWKDGFGRIPDDRAVGRLVSDVFDNTILLNQVYQCSG